MHQYSFSKITVRALPSIHDLGNRYIVGDNKCLINVSEKVVSEAYLNKLKELGLEYYQFPLKEEVDDIGWDNVKKAVQVLALNHYEEIPTLVCCTCGNHRSPLVAEAFYLAFDGDMYEDEYKGHINHLMYDIEEGHLPVSVEEAKTDLLNTMPMQTVFDHNITQD